MSDDDKTSAVPDVSEAQKLYEKDKAAWSDIYEAAREDLQFYVGGTDQWDAADLAVRKRAKRPALTTNLLPQFVHQVVNDLRANVPQMKCLPDDDTGDIDTAKTIQGLFKNIEYTSNAPVAYDTGAENSVKCSLGWIRLDHDYDDPYSFDEKPLQHIRIKRVVNPLSVMIDSTSVECDGSDAKHGIALDPFTKAEFEEKWPDKEAVSFDGPAAKTNDDVIIVAEFFKVVPTDVEICQLQDGTIMTLEKAQSMQLQPVRTKTIKKNKVRRQRLSGADVLEETWFPGEFIPLIPVYGEEHWVDGKRHLFSLIRHAKDPQRMVNAWASLETELLSKAPQAPFIMAEGQAEGHEDDWSNIGTKMVAQYKQTDVNGQPAPPPQRVAPPPIPTGVVNARQSAVQDMRDAMGIQQAGLGQRSNEKSGIAIQARQKEGDVSNAHFGDNLNRSICHVGRVFLSMLPEIYDTPRIVKILGEEGDPQTVAINGATPQEGQEKVFDLTVGKYNVSIIAGPSYTTRRQETQAMMTQLMQGNPALMQVMGDLMFKYSDMPGADVIAARLKKTIPPQLLEDDKGQADPAALQAQVQQAGQQLQQAHDVIGKGQQFIQELKGKLQQTQSQLENKQGDLQLKSQEMQMKTIDLQSKSQVDQLNIQIKSKELDIKQQELQLRAREIDLQEKQLALEAQSLVATPLPPVPMNIQQPPA